MYSIDIVLKDEDSTVLQSKQIYLTTIDKANDLMESFKLSSLEEEYDDMTPDGRIVTPLPPGKTHSTQGVVTPKAPLEVIRQDNKRTQEIPEELLPNEPE